MGLRKKKSLVDQAIDQATDVVDALRPRLDSAYGQAKDFVHDTALPVLADARDKATPVIADAYDKASDKAAPVFAAAGAKAAPVLADARGKAAPLAAVGAKAAPVLADARDKAAPLVATGASWAGDNASAVRSLAEAKVAELKGEKPKKRSKLKVLLLVAVVGGGVAVVAKKLQGGGQSDNWQSSYTPSPAPKPAAPQPVTSVEDAGGAGPDEAIADAVEAPHPVTTPDEPAEVVDIDPDAKK